VQLRTLAEIATILGLGVAVLAHMNVEPNALEKIPELYQEQATEDLSKLASVNAVPEPKAWVMMVGFVAMFAGRKRQVTGNIG